LYILELALAERWLSVSLGKGRTLAKDTVKPVEGNKLNPEDNTIQAGLTDLEVSLIKHFKKYNPELLIEDCNGLPSRT